MLKNIKFIKEHYKNQIETLNDFIKDAYPNLPNQNSSLFNATVHVESIKDIIAKKIE
jgi:hypothetical protein